jgi:uncharacterized protein YjiS (DUF1127 family)
MKGQKGFVQVRPAPARVFGVAWLKAAAARIGRWRELARQRRALASLSDSALHDLGLSRADISAETERPFWDDPLHR